MEVDVKSLIAELKRDEGCRLRSYQDSRGTWTIGYGTNLETLEVDFATAEYWLRERVDKSIAEAARLPVWAALDPSRRRVLVNMVYNVGLRGVQGFHNMLEAIERKDYVWAAREMLDSNWALQVGSRARRLAALMLTGEMPDTIAATDIALAPLLEHSQR